MPTSQMHVRQWEDREVAAFNALHSRDPFIKQLVNRWPVRSTEFYVLRWRTEKGIAKAAVHFCEGEANWRARVFAEGGLQARVERRFGTGTDSHVLVDSRQRSGCQCHNCSAAVGDLQDVAKPKTMSSARARKLARSM